MPLLHIEHLNFQYALSEEPALRDISLDVEQGEFLLLFGPSGSGKTTLLRHLKRELIPEGKRDGAVLFDGAPLESLAPLRSAAEIGLVMQNPDSQIVTDEVWHELAFGLENLGLENGVIRRRVAEMASFFGIGSWFHKKTDELSGGQKQMLNLASILAMQPRLLLLDEPAAMLDPVSSREFGEMVARLNREFGITVVMASHKLEEVFPLASRAALLDRGRLLACGAPRSFCPYLSENPRFLRYMPAATRIYFQSRGMNGSEFPITVNDGKRLLTPHLSAPAKPASPAARKREKPVLEARNLWFRYGKDSPDVLRSLSVGACAGELTCILGENGAGKSTLLNLLAGMLRPSHGSVRLNGGDIRKLGGRLYRGSLALLPQNPKALFARETVLEELTVGAEVSGSSPEEVRKTAEEFGISHLLKRHPYDLSGGETRRAALGKLMLTRPRVLLLDEPTAGLDADAQDALSALLKKLCGEGICIIMITHDIEFAAGSADRCLLLFDGEIACEGAPSEFFGGNFFYTTAANRIARGIAPDAVTCGDVMRLCRNDES